MAKQKFYTILTNRGKSKTAQSAANGTKINFRYFALGDGGGRYYDPIESQTELKNEVWRGSITLVDIDKKNPNWVLVETVVPANVGGFVVREVGVFDDDGDLIAVGNYPETYKPILTEGSAKDLTVRMIIEIANVAAVNLEVDPSVTLATKKDVRIHEESNMPHLIRDIDNSKVYKYGLQVKNGVTQFIYEEVL